MTLYQDCSNYDDLLNNMADREVGSRRLGVGGGGGGYRGGGGWCGGFPIYLKRKNI